MVRSLRGLSGMPQMGAAFQGWQTSITIGKVTQAVADNGRVSDTVENITFQGVVQPLSAKQIALKPEGERAWQWYQIHCFSTALNLDTHDKIMYDGKKYKVMGIWNYKLNNYVEYHIIEDYQSP